MVETIETKAYECVKRADNSWNEYSCREFKEEVYNWIESEYEEDCYEIYNYYLENEEKLLKKIDNEIEINKNDLINSFEDLIKKYENICTLTDCDYYVNLMEINDYMSNEFEKYNLKGFMELIDDDNYNEWDIINENYNSLYEYLRELLFSNLKL